MSYVDKRRRRLFRADDTEGRALSPATSMIHNHNYKHNNNNNIWQKRKIQMYTHIHNRVKQ